MKKEQLKRDFKTLSLDDFVKKYPDCPVFAIQAVDWYEEQMTKTGEI